MIKALQIGVGGWGKKHARVLHEMNALAGICDTDENYTLAKQYGVPHYTNVETAIESLRFDAAIVATPTITHHDIAHKLIQAGKHTLIEKPFTYEPDQGRQLTGLARKKGVIISCGYIERFNPAIQAVREMVDRKTYGRPVLLEFHRENRIPVHIKDVGIIYDTAVHDIDTANWLFGEMPHVVFARFGRIEHTHEDYATIMLGYPGNNTAIISCNWLSPRRVRVFRAAFTDAVVTGDFITREIDVDGHKMAVRDAEPLRMELESFLEAARIKRDPIVLPQQAVWVSEIARAALASGKQNAPIHLDLR